MKLQLIANICKSMVMLVLAIGIFQLYLKGIVPIYTILFLLVAGGIIRLLARLASFVATILIVLILIGMLV